MGKTLYTNVNIFDGSSKRTFAGEVLIQGNMVNKVTKGKSKIKAKDATVIDGAGMTLMPGLVESHSHVCYNNCATLADIGRVPPEEHMILAIENAKIMLDQGFTSLFSAAGVGRTKMRLEVALRNAINAGKFPGPRLRAAGPEITATGSLGDERQLHMYQESVGFIADGVDEVLRACRMCAREGVDNLKINISGDEFSAPGQSEQTTYSDAEVAAAAQVGRERGLTLCCHARADSSVRMALKHGFTAIYHADYANNKTIDMLDAKKKDIFLAPAAGAIYATAYEAGDWGITREVAENMNLFRKMENTARVYNELRKRGVRCLPGGDYGFAWTPIGTNARDIEHFVNLFGYSPAEALKAATMWGGELMGMNTGQVKEGYLADLLLVDGDPTKDVSILQDSDRLVGIMLDGSFHKTPDADILGRRRQQGGAVAAE